MPSASNCKACSSRPSRNADPAGCQTRRDEDANTRWQFTRGQERCDVEVSVRLVSTDGIGLIDAIVGGCGVARPFDISVRHLLRNGDLMALLQDWGGDRLPICAVLPPQGRATPTVRLFLDFLSSVLSDDAEGFHANGPGSHRPG